MTTQPRIVIIGAGASGIAAATRLLENGFNEITLLEAEDRIGGRVNSVEFGGSMVDLGGQWVHGEEGNIVYQMVKDLDLLSPSHNTYDDNTYFLSDGTVVDKNTTDKLFEICSRVMDDVDDALKYPGTFGKYFIKRYNELVLEEFGNNKDIFKIAKLLEEWFHKFFTCLDSCKTWYDISTRGAMMMFKPCEGDQQLNWRQRGFHTILDVLMKKYPDPSKQLPIEGKILLRKEVAKIIWDDIDNDEGAATVLCADGSSFHADHVLVTVSVGVLKKFHRDWFVPQLPPFKVNSIEHIALGTVNKILLRFSTRWWPEDLKGFSLLWTEDDKLNIPDHFTPKDEKGRSWLEDVFGFYVIDSHPRVLLGWVVGPTAAEVELLSEEEVTSGCFFLLRKFAGRQYDIPEPEAVLRSKWNSNPHFCGSYVYVGLDQEVHNATAEDLAKPLKSKTGKETLLFAGEATSETRYSTVHGAIETGYREAGRLIEMVPIHKKIVIVGAGMAGLGAAYELTKLHFDDFLVIEAQEQPGGRVRAITVDGKPLDLGAQWLHGKENPLYDLALKHNLLTEIISEEGSGKYVRNDGVVFDEDLVDEVETEVERIIEECVAFLHEEIFPNSLGDFLFQKFAEYLESCDDSDEEREMKLQLFDWHVRYQMIDNSCESLYKLSAKWWGTYLCDDNSALSNLKNGFGSIVNVIVDQIPRDNIVYNTCLRNVRLEGPLIKLTCDNRTVTCDHLILTPSLGVLKDFNGLDTVLTQSHNDAITNMGFHSIGKIFLFFNEKWWDDVMGFQLLWGPEEGLEENERWVRNISGFDVIHGHPNCLLGWLGGSAVRVMETLSEQEVGAICVKVLRKFLVDYQVPDPSKVFRSKWLSNPWIKGSYCNITPECDKSGLGTNKLSEPVYVDGVPRILLAGEAVNVTHHSTTHGAYESGHQQASFLYNFIKNSD
ncbi:uncharacterized protein isoform X2 [Leptinotarsa decemlineata]|uniref:uncharacterized protein isoform X2 n=1 Tax=Leptinotarsa decemlineata TaxID=7539 RepID=UPI000C254AFD|nr:spermine oxidase-like isoform X2 [Leptinotarsa decemlineata]